MAGLFMCLAFPRGLLGFDFGSQSWLPSLPLIPSGIPSWHHLLPSKLHLGFHLGFLGFQLSSILDSLFRSRSSYPPAAARSFSAPLTRRPFRHKRLNSDDCTLHAGSGKSPLSSECFTIRRGPCAARLASATTRPQQAQPINH